MSTRHVVASRSIAACASRTTSLAGALLLALLASPAHGGTCNALCPSDLNGDGSTDGADLGLLLAAWGTADPCADLNGDATVDGADLGLLLAGWGDCPEGECPPSDHDCLTSGGPGCSDVECCELVCAADPFCCDTAWDATCVAQAIALCTSSACSQNGGIKDCFYPHSTPGCNSPAECCEMVCDLLPSCCLFEWDPTCVAQACLDCTSSIAFFCVEGSTPEGEPCGADVNGGCNLVLPASNCCAATGLPGCGDQACEDVVCAADSFCCAVAWDGLCAEEARDLCGALCAPTNEFGAIAVGETICGTLWAGDGFRDADWYSFTLSETTSVTITAESDLPFDLVLVGGDGCDPAAITIGLSTSRRCGSVRLIRACLAAASYSIVVAPPEFDGLPCTETRSSYSLAVEGGGRCTACEESDHGCFDTGGPGCTDLACCEGVCAVDLFCCNTGWDELCVLQALSICKLPPCEVTCGDGATAEPEACGVDSNGGCNPPNDPRNPALTAIACGETVCGTAWADGDLRDTDWYELELFDSPGTLISFSGSSSLPLVLGVVDTNGIPECELASELSPFVVLTFCGAGGFEVCLGPGTHWLFAAPNAFAGFPCGSFNDYAITVECLRPCAPASCGDAGHGCLEEGGPFCDDEACCLKVCAFDPFCCAAAWDLACVDSALALCYAGLSTCCYASGGLGCDDAVCLDCVCAADAFCCDVAWDGLCAESAGANGLCGASCPCGG